MRKNDIYILKDKIFRILQIKDDNCLAKNCNGNSMPIWMPLGTFGDIPTISRGLSIGLPLQAILSQGNKKSVM